MQCTVITIFPEMFSGFLQNGIVTQAIKKNKLNVEILNLRDYTDPKKDKHRTVDDKPFGGGAGMVMKPEPLIKAIKAVKGENKKNNNINTRVIYLSPQGTILTHARAEQIAQDIDINNTHLIFIAGRYEGIDERVIEHYIDEEWSIGDFVLSGGELAAQVYIDAIVRLIPGVLGHQESNQQDSFGNNIDGLLDHPQYTRPAIFEGLEVPAVLQSGDHQAIAKWRLEQRVLKTKQKRPDLLNNLKN